VRRALERVGPEDERFMRDQLRLSARSRYVYAKKSGHNVPMTEPGLISKEVKWVLKYS
jgi:hypothetical protein